jgi:very-short-patch-repair endonuclease
MALPPEILQNARELRTRSTEAEELLWLVLRNRQFCGFKFRRQHPVSRFILDFYCHEAKLAIELDGSGHSDDDQMVYDAERTKELEAADIKVLRFWNRDVLTKIESVMDEIYRVLCSPDFPSSGLRPPSP